MTDGARGGGGEGRDEKSMGFVRGFIEGRVAGGSSGGGGSKQ